MRLLAVLFLTLVILGAGTAAAEQTRLLSVDSTHLDQEDSLSQPATPPRNLKLTTFEGEKAITYLVVSGHVSWPVARDSAIVLGGHLVTINSPTEQATVATLVSNGSWWIGATDAATEGSWQWVTGEPWTYANWYPGEPNGGTAQNYAFMSADLGYRWIDAGTTTTDGFIVELGSLVYPLPNHFLITDSIDETYIKTLAPTFQWQFQDTVAGAQTAFQIQVGTDLDWTTAEMWNFGPVSSAATSVQYGGSALSEQTEYFVRMRVKNSSAWGDWVTRKFIPFIINQHRYLLVTVPKTWTTAVTIANNSGGHLVTITSQTESDYVISTFGSSGVVRAYIGATDAASEGNWRWINAEIWSYTNWYGTEPNNGGGNENYGEIRFDLGGKWNDQDGVSLRPYIIEWDVLPPPSVTFCKVDNQTNNQHVVSTNPLFTWNSQNVLSTQSKVEIEVGNDTLWDIAELWDPAPITSSDTLTGYAGAPLVDGTTYYVRVRVYGAAQWSNWYSTSFRLNSKPTSPIVNTTPTVRQTLTPTVYLQNSLDPEEDALTYSFQIYSNSQLTALVAQGNVIPEGTDSTGWTSTTTLTENAQYWWRGRASDSYEQSDWSATGTFSIDATPEPPTAPVLLSPPDSPDEALEDLHPTFSWQASTDPDPLDQVRYRLELAQNPLFVSAIAVDSLASTSYSFAASLTPGKHYWWRASAKDKDGFSIVSVSDFWTAMTPLVDGMLENSHVVTAHPVLLWNAQDVSNSQTSFEIAVGNDNDWSFAELWSPAPFASSDTSTAYNGVTLDDGATYYFRLRVSDGSEWSPWRYSQFRTNSAPSTPVAVTDSILLPSLTPTLYLLNATDPENDALTYEYEVYADDALTALVAIGSEPEQFDSTGWEVSSMLDEDTPYWWRGRAFDGFTYSDWSSVGSFFTNAISSPPTVPTLLSPAGSGGTIYNLTPLFTWTGATDPDPFDSVLYKLEVSINPNFTFLTIVDSVAETARHVVDSLEFNTHYWWRVTSYDSYSLTSVSEVGDFWTWTLADINNSHTLSVVDLNYLVAFFFLGGDAPNPLLVADVNGDCVVNVVDLNYLVAYFFLGGSPPQVGCAP